MRPAANELKIQTEYIYFSFVGKTQNKRRKKQQQQKKRRQKN